MDWFLFFHGFGINLSVCPLKVIGGVFLRLILRKQYYTANITNLVLRFS